MDYQDDQGVSPSAHRAGGILIAVCGFSCGTATPLLMQTRGQIGLPLTGLLGQKPANPNQLLRIRMEGSYIYSRHAVDGLGTVIQLVYRQFCAELPGPSSFDA